MQASKGPERTWTIGKYRFGMYSLFSWECEAGGLGSHGSTPIGAFIDQRRWAKEYKANTHKYIEDM